MEVSTYWGNRHKECPVPEERNEIKVKWSCDEYI